MTKFTINAAAVLAFAPLACTVSPAAAQPNAPVAASISATAHTQKVGWLTTQGPDAQGRLTAWIETADIDSATPRGQARLQTRIALAAEVLCEKAADGPELAGYYDAGARQCRADVQSSAASGSGHGMTLTASASR